MTYVTVVFFICFLTCSNKKIEFKLIKYDLQSIKLSIRSIIINHRN
jgi:hypothetical protein